ncbi:hypothetical protein QJQ45_016801 [Haematococcus lacustris]|nr:hypothetical protein QJQ45_016801 [Haematococcus lacustris]
MEPWMDPPSPTRSVASVASTAFSEACVPVEKQLCTPSPCRGGLPVALCVQRAPRGSIPAAIQSKTKEELQLFTLDLLKKLKAKDKKLAEVTAALSQSPSKEPKQQLELESISAEAAALKERCAQLNRTLDTAQAQLLAVTAERDAATEQALAAEAARQRLAQEHETEMAAQQAAKMAQQELVHSLQQQLQASSDASAVTQQAMWELQDREKALQQQLASLREAVQAVSSERAAAYDMVGEHKERAAELREALALAQQAAAGWEGKAQQAAGRAAGAEAQLAQLTEELQAVGRRAEQMEAEVGATRASACLLQAQLQQSLKELQPLQHQLLPILPTAAAALHRACQAADASDPAQLVSALLELVAGLSTPHLAAAGSSGLPASGCCLGHPGSAGCLPQTEGRVPSRTPASVPQLPRPAPDIALRSAGSAEVGGAAARSSVKLRIAELEALLASAQASCTGAVAAGAVGGAGASAGASTSNSRAVSRRASRDGDSLVPSAAVEAVGGGGGLQAGRPCPTAVNSHEAHDRDSCLMPPQCPAHRAQGQPDPAPALSAGLVTTGADVDSPDLQQPRGPADPVHHLGAARGTSTGPGPALPGAGRREDVGVLQGDLIQQLRERVLELEGERSQVLDLHDQVSLELSQRLQRLAEVERTAAAMRAALAESDSHILELQQLLAQCNQVDAGRVLGQLQHMLGLIQQLDGGEALAAQISELQLSARGALLQQEAQVRHVACTIGVTRASRLAACCMFPSRCQLTLRAQAVSGSDWCDGPGSSEPSSPGAAKPAGQAATSSAAQPPSSFPQLQQALGSPDSQLDPHTPRHAVLASTPAGSALSTPDMQHIAPDRPGTQGEAGAALASNPTYDQEVATPDPARPCSPPAALPAALQQRLDWLQQEVAHWAEGQGASCGQLRDLEQQLAALRLALPAVTSLLAAARGEAQLAGQQVQQLQAQLHAAQQQLQQQLGVIGELEAQQQAGAAQVKQQAAELEVKAGLAAGVYSLAEGAPAHANGAEDPESSACDLPPASSSHDAAAGKCAPSEGSPGTEPSAQLAEDNARLAKELADTKRKLLLLAKKRSAESAASLKEAEQRAAELSTRVAEAEALREQLAGLRAEAEAAGGQLVAARAETEALQSRLAEAQQSLALRERELASSQGLVAEYKSLMAQREAGAQAAAAKLERELKQLRVERDLAVGHVEGRLRDREVEVEGLTAQLARAEAELFELRRSSASAASDGSAEQTALRAEAEAARQEAQALKASLEAERVKLGRALEEAKKRLAKATKAQHTAEMAAAEARGKVEAEQQSHRLEVLLASQGAEAAQRSVTRLEAELRDYKSRAQLLLRAKDAELAALKEAASSTAQSEHQVQQLQAQLATALAGEGAALAAQADLEQRLEEQTAEATEALQAATSELQRRVEYLAASASEAAKEAAELRNRCEVLEARLAHHQSSGAEQLEEAQQRAAASQLRISQLEAELQRQAAAAAAAQASSEALMEARDEEVLALVRKNALLLEDVAALRSQLACLQCPAHPAGVGPGGHQAGRASQPGARQPPSAQEAQEPWPTGLMVDSTQEQQGDDSECHSFSQWATPTLGLGAGPRVESAPALAPAAAGLGTAAAGILSALMETGTGELPNAEASSQEQPSPAGPPAGAGHRSSAAEQQEVPARFAAALAASQQRVRQLEVDVQELEKEVALREEMECALKESFRELERAARRNSTGHSHIDAEYLKNTVLKMFRTGEAEQLLPVFATILAFSPEETNSCKVGLERIKQGQEYLALGFKKQRDRALKAQAQLLVSQ